MGKNMVMATLAEDFLSRIFHNNLLKAACTMAIIVLIFPGYSDATDWKVSPTLNLIETYSDNVRLAPPGNEKGDYITQVNPGITIAGTGPRLQIDARYLMQNLFYAEEKNRNSTNHLFNARANAELVDDYFYLDAKSSISQQSISPLAPITFDNTNIINDRTEVRTYSISPYFHHNFGSLVSSKLRYTHNAVDTNAKGLLDSRANNILFQLKSGPAFNRQGWELNYSKENIDYIKAFTDTENEKYSLKLSYKILSKFSLTASGGYEKHNYLSINKNPEGPFWLAGFSWVPSDRTSIAASAGKRFYGNTYSLMADHRTRRTVWSLGYNEGITNTNSQFVLPATIDTAIFLDQLWSSSIPDPVIRKQIVDDFIIQNGLSASLANPVNFLTNRVFLQKLFQASLAISGAKNTILFSMLSMLRESQTSQISDSALFGINNMALSDTSKQLSANILWNWKISARNSTNVGIGYIRNSFPAIDRQFDTKSMNISLIRKFQPTVSGSLGLRHIQRESSDAINEYSENAITASVQMIF